MIILGLGSNLGDRLANLRAALHDIKKMEGLKVNQVSPVYISDAALPENAPADWDAPYLNVALRCEINIEPSALLKKLKDIEKHLGRASHPAKWSPRVMDIDILAFNDLVLDSEELTIPHKHLLERPFALWPLADVAPTWLYPNLNKTAAELVEPWGSRFSSSAPFHTYQIHHRIDTPQLVGILNVTPNSFSDGGQFMSVESAMQQALHLIHSGAEIIDIGAESTAPGAPLLTSDTEWTRLVPVLTAINAVKNYSVVVPKISVDTRHADIAAKAFDLGADWINDVTGLKDPAMRDLVASTKVDCVVMHHLSIPVSSERVLPRNQDPVKLVYEWAARHFDDLEKAGVARNKMIFDPGIGFGKTPEQSFMLIKHVEVFTKLGARILVGHSRKSFFSLFTQSPSQERDVETLATTLYLASQPVDYLRVHNVEMSARGMNMAMAFK